MIRKLNTEDINAVMNIWLKENKQAHHFIEESYWENHFYSVKEMISETEVYVYEQNSKICGFIGLMDDYIAGIFVSKVFQSKGIGKQLLDFVKTKYSTLSLHVYQQNTCAIQFYLREDFSFLKAQTDEETGKTEIAMHWHK